MKIVVFDLDETLGYFTQFGILWDSLKQHLKDKNNQTLSQQDFNDILDLYPEVLRPNIINILTYLKKKKQTNNCHKMMIYTNNTGPVEWARHIIKYFEEKIKFKIIDQLIAAFKVNGKTIEICRTTHSKTHKDLIKCTKIPANAEICFLDDTYYPEMVNDHIYYINIKPYYHDLPFETMIERLTESKIGKIIAANDEDFELSLLDSIKSYKYKCIEKDPAEYELDKVLGKQIVMHLYEFFNKTCKNKTIKNRGKHHDKHHNKTYKHK
jgi:hypothetical protein